MPQASLQQYVAEPLAYVLMLISYKVSSVPQTEINNLVYRYAVGSCVGGSSAVNGMVFDRGSKADYDAWEELGNPGWDWDGLFPYFKKSVGFTPPSEADAKQFGYTWDEEAWGHGPVQASFPPFQWEALSELYDYSWIQIKEWLR